MIVLGALAVGMAMLLGAGLIVGLLLTRRWLRTRRAANPALPAHEGIRETLGAVILALLIAPPIFCFLFVPIVEVSADGERQLGMVKPRLIENLGTAALVALIASAAIAA
ncbi:MAG TPA: hypothetical protein VM509_09910, partial [Planctomycetota bacterium]|nr:hypothetical protein [Planctomycetota bacterium]